MHLSILAENLASILIHFVPILYGLKILYFGFHPNLNMWLQNFGLAPNNLVQIGPSFKFSASVHLSKVDNNSDKNSSFTFLFKLVRVKP